MFTKSSEYGRRAAATTPPSLWDPVGASVAYWAWLSRVSEIWWTRSAGRARDRRRAPQPLRRAGALRTRPIARSIARPIADFRRGGSNRRRAPVVTKRSADGTLRRLGHDPRRDARPASRRSSPIGSRSASGFSAVTSSGRAPAAPASRASSFRMPTRSRSFDALIAAHLDADALRSALLVATARPRRTGRAHRRDRRSLRQHRVVAAAVSGQPVARRAQLLDHGSAAGARRRTQRVSARVSRQLSDDAGAARRRRKARPAARSIRSACGPAANISRPAPRVEIERAFGCPSSTNTAPRSA